MKTWSAQFDRRITFVRPIATRDGRFNTRQKGWVDHVTVYAQVRDVLPSKGEQIAEGIDISRKPCRVRIRWRADVSSQMRVRIAGVEYEITAEPATIGRRELLELVCEHVSTQGDGP